MDQDYLKSRIAKLVSERNVKKDTDPKDQAIMDLFQDSISYKYSNSPIDLECIKSIIYNDIKNIEPKDHMSFFGSDIRYMWGSTAAEIKTDKIIKNTIENKRMYIMEDTFIRSIATVSHKFTGIDPVYLNSCGYTIDDLSHYVDATRPSRMELVINSDLEITEEQKQRARVLINKIIENKITKYNNQPIYEPNIGRDGVPKILVIDQSYNDSSILKGMGSDQTFKNMLDSAINDNPGADIIIKTHPDAVGSLSLKQKCYYQYVEEKENVYKITDMINPISLINYVDKVYVCSSQFGFESLMCNKETHIFGMPFYAGWGLTHDAQKLERRTKQRSLEEIFYIAYIMFSIYINPKTNKPCEIEDAIDFLIDLRYQYFKEQENG
tara:strand:+ start:177 stop:1319 length:1143 start_codon:yes stop_codon:yes gene_type:complete